MNAYSNKNGVKLLAMVAVLAMVVCAFAALMPATETDAVSSDTEPLYISGTITKNQDFEAGTNVIVESGKELVIPDEMYMNVGGNFTVEAGASVVVEEGGSLTFESTSIVKIDGDVTANGNGAVIQNESKYTQGTDSGVVVTGSITLEKGASLKQETTAGHIVLKTGATLDVTKSSSNISEIRNQVVYIYEGATFTVNGYAKGVEIRATGDASYYTAGAMQLHNENIDSAADNNRSTSNLTFTVTTQTASAYTSNTAGSPGQAVTIRQYILNVDGTVDGIQKTDETYSPDVLKVIAGVSKAKVVSGKTYGDQTYYEVVDKETAGDAYIPTVSVTGKLDVDVNGSFVASGSTYTMVSGNVSYDYNDKNNATEGANSASLNGYLYVTGNITVNVENIKDTDGLSNGTLYVDGGKVTVYDADAGIFSKQPYGPIGMYGAAYETDGDNAALIICDFDVAVSEAITAEATDVYVMGLYDTSNPATADDAVASGAYVIDTSVSIPDEMVIYFWNNVVITSNTVVTFVDGSEAEVVQGVIYVDGKLVDQSGTFDYTGMQNDVKYEVKKVSEDELTTTYTTLAIALAEAAAGEKIELNGLVIIDENMTIPAEVTVVSDTEGLQITDGATLTINGTLDLNGATVAFTKNTEGKADGKIVLNNVIVSSANTYIASGADDAAYTIDGAYFQAEIEGYDGEYFVTSVSVAAQNSSSVEYGGITLVGKLSFGDVTFTKGADADNLEIVIADNATVTAGTITLESASMTIGETITENDTTSFTGTVVLKATAGDVTVQLSKAKYIQMMLYPTDNGETVTYDAQIGSSVEIPTRSPMLGEITIATGAITLVDDVRVVDLTIADGAEFIVDEGNTLYADDDDADYDANKMPIDVDAIIENVAPVTVNGTLTVNGGLQWDFVVVNGALTFGEKATASFNADIHGTVTITDGAQVAMPVAVVYGSINGEMTTIALLAYPGSDITAAVINDTDNDGDTDANVTDFYLNGELSVTFYTSMADVPVTLFAYIANDPSVMADTGVFYSDEAMTDKIASIPETGFQNAAYTWITNALAGSATPNPVLGTAYTDDYDAVYVSMDAALARGTISEGTGLSLFIDNIAYYPQETPGHIGTNYILSVGTHTIRYDVNAGYDGSNATITFNGQTVENGGTIEITVDMITDGFNIVASGAVPASYVVESGSSDSGMGLTDYLLIILVILIVVMAIMVAMRLMRS